MPAPDSPKSPKSPVWGPSAAQKADFRWQVQFGGESGDQPFNTSDEACQQFGFRHNDAVRFTAPGSLWAGRRALVLGVNMGCLWVQLEGEARARDLKHCFDAEAIQAAHGLVHLPEDERRELFSGDVPDRTDAAPDFVPAADQSQLCHYEYPGVHGIFEFDASPAACAPFGYQHGERIRASLGSERGRTAVVIGVHSGVLWVHFYGDRAATACHYCHTQEELHAKYGWIKVHAPPAIPPAPAGVKFHQSVSAPPSRKPSAAGAPVSRQGSELPSRATTDPRRWIEYPVPFGMTHHFDRSDEALEPFGVRHGDILKATKGAGAGKQHLVIGVLNGTLWVHEEGDRSASACKFCADAADLEERYAFKRVDRVVVEPNVPYFKGRSTIQQRQEEAQAILARPPDGEPWEDGAQPQTYRFLRAYARWRLPKSTPRGQAFMLYYVKDTAVRTTEALENLAVLRKFWAMRREQGIPMYAKAFADATEKELYQSLQQVPLQALTIYSSTS